MSQREDQARKDLDLALMRLEQGWYMKGQDAGHKQGYDLGYAEGFTDGAELGVTYQKER